MRYVELLVLFVFLFRNEMISVYLTLKFSRKLSFDKLLVGSSFCRLHSDELDLAGLLLKEKVFIRSRQVNMQPYCLATPGKLHNTIQRTITQTN